MSSETNHTMTNAGPLRLLAMHAQARPAVKELDQVVTILGSGDGADLMLGSSRVDAAHTAIVSLPGGTYVCDLGAPCGTCLGGRHIRWSRLADGDELSIGPFSFRVQLEDELYESTPSIPVFQLRNDQTIGTIVSSEPAMVIGSDPCCDIILKDASIEPRHALIVWTVNGTIVRDLTGRASVRHNGRAVQMNAIAAGDAIGIGPYELIYEFQTESADPESVRAPVKPAVAAPTPQVTTIGSSEPDAAPHEISPMPWLDERHVESATTDAAEEWSEFNEGPDFDLFEDESETVTESVDDDAFEDLQDQDTEELEMPEDMTPQPYESRSAPVEQFPPQLKARVAAAQRALDERARKLREELESERAQIKACQDKLQQQARQLLEVARHQQEESKTQHHQHDESMATSYSYEPEDTVEETYEETEAPAAPFSASTRPVSRPDVSVLENIFAGKFDVAAAPAPAESRPAPPAGTRVDVETTEHANSLQQRVSELVNMVRDEKEEMSLAESRLDSLRFEIDRLRGTVLRAKEKHQVREAEHEARYTALKRSQSAIRHERESLMARMRRLDSKESVLSARVQEAERIRQDLEVESERLNHAQEEHDERLRELRINLEGERHRLRVRQAELQRKAADLAKLARTRRKAIEEIVSRQQSELKDQESELKARRSAVAEAGRAELERAATELEQLLSARLADVETEVLSRQENLDNWLKAIWDAAKPMTEPTAASTTASTGVTAYKFEPFAPRISTGGDKTEGERGHMALLEKELEGLHRAVRKLEDDSDRRSMWQDSAPAPLRDRSISSADRRIDSVFTSKFSEKIASIRKGLIDLGPAEEVHGPAPAASSQEKVVDAQR